MRIRVRSCLLVTLLAGCHEPRSRPNPPGPQADQTTRWPLLTDRLPDLDTSRVFTFPGDSFRIFRTDISIIFKPGVTDSAKAAFFRRHSMTVIGLTLAGRFFVRVPDPGPSGEAFRRMLDALGREPEIEVAALIPRDPLEER